MSVWRMALTRITERRNPRRYGRRDERRTENLRAQDLLLDDYCSASCRPDPQVVAGACPLRRPHDSDKRWRIGTATSGGRKTDEGRQLVGKWAGEWTSDPNRTSPEAIWTKRSAIRSGATECETRDTQTHTYGATTPGLILSEQHPTDYRRASSSLVTPNPLKNTRCIE